MSWKLVAAISLTIFAAYQLWRGLVKGRVLGRFGSDYVRVKHPGLFWIMFALYAVWLASIGFIGLLALAGRISN